MSTPAHAVLQGLSSASRRDFLRRCVLRRFGRDEVIFHEGDPGDSIHLVRSGRVAFRLTTPLGDTVLLSVVGPGGFFGELALLGRSGRRTATAICLDPVETWAMRRPVFEQLCSEHPEAAGFVQSALVARIERLSTLLVEAHFLPAEQRVLHRLSELLELEEGPLPSTLRITQEDLAGLAGTTRSTVNRTLQREQQAGRIRLGRGAITVLEHSHTRTASW